MNRTKSEKIVKTQNHSDLKNKQKAQPKTIWLITDFWGFFWDTQEA